ncbi:CsbD family protein [Facklamia sp. DSM 111018]|uniref:CsbD family protein n=1 Tax=Facklamia lactis TaxID=2749967 RepID=A0ABS0LM76_9LACT|nr:CsbD family protein [Facklamia lactis]MBG9985270.1 CsbD family protein [Facklamia lactis]
MSQENIDNKLGQASGKLKEAAGKAENLKGKIEEVSTDLKDSIKGAIEGLKKDKD